MVILKTTKLFSRILPPIHRNHKPQRHVPPQTILVWLEKRSGPVPRFFRRKRFLLQVHLLFRLASFFMDYVGLYGGISRGIVVFALLELKQRRAEDRAKAENNAD
jgi:hypothetical protein